MPTISISAPTANAGVSRVYGSVTFAGSPDVPAPGAIAQLYKTAGAPKWLAQLSADSTGAYEFAGIPSEKTLVLALDVTGQYDPVCKTNLIPSPMPPDPSEHV